MALEVRTNIDWCFDLIDQGAHAPEIWEGETRASYERRLIPWAKSERTEKIVDILWSNAQAQALQITPEARISKPRRSL